MLIYRISRITFLVAQNHTPTHLRLYLRDAEAHVDGSTSISWQPGRPRRPIGEGILATRNALSTGREGQLGRPGALPQESAYRLEDCRAVLGVELGII